MRGDYNHKRNENAQRRATDKRSSVLSLFYHTLGVQNNFIYAKIPKMKTGKIKPNGVILQPHELKTVVFLTELGHNIELIPKSNIYGIHTPDIKMSSISWEIKCPKGEGKYLIQNTLHKAAHQSENIILDLRRIKIHQTKCLREIEKQFTLSRRLKRIKIITKSRKIIDLNK